jgi:hypothetical protein
MNISFERGCHEGRFQASSATVEEIELESDHGFLVSAPFWQKTVTGNRGLSPKYTALQPTRYSGLRPLTRSAELERWALEFAGEH